VSNIQVEHAHSLGLEEVRARVHALGDYLTTKHGIAVTWEGDRASVKGRYLVVVIEGSVTLEADKVTFEAKDPGLLWRSKAKEYLTRKLAKYLDPQTPLSELPRA
jgi:putative polyhydroxyalkanoate system protein